LGLCVARSFSGSLGRQLLRWVPDSADVDFLRCLRFERVMWNPVQPLRSLLAGFSDIVFFFLIVGPQHCGLFAGSSSPFRGSRVCPNRSSLFSWSSRPQAFDPFVAMRSPPIWFDNRESFLDAAFSRVSPI